MQGKHIPSLDGLRGVAALIVVVSHYSNETGVFGGILGWGGGQIGVMLFFLLAGFLMTHLYLEQRLTLKNLAEYAVKRFARVYPFFVLVAALPAFLIWTGFPGTIAMSDVNTLTIYLRQVLLVNQGSNVFWTIQVEIFFYIAFVALWFLHQLFKAWQATLVLLFLILVILTLWPPEFTVQFFSKVHYFIFGMFSALLMSRRKNMVINERLNSIVGVILLLTIPLTFPKILSTLAGYESNPWSNPLVMVQLFILFNIALRDQKYLKAVLTSAPLRWLGKVSYSMYLLHYFALDAIVSFTDPKSNYLLNFIIVFVSTLIVSGFSYRYLERPIQKFFLTWPAVIGRNLRITSRGRAPT